MNLLKKVFIPFLFGLVLFLTPFSIGLEESISGNNLIVITENITYAINLSCDVGTTGLGDFGCQVKEAVLSVYEIIFFSITQIFVVLAGFILDNFLFFSIDSQFYRSGIIEAGWEIIRDFTNIVFILALLIAAFRMVLGIGGSDAKKKILHTILIALVINFSLFITYAVIDASNVLAHVFYNRIDSSADNYSTQITASDSDTFSSSDQTGITGTSQALQNVIAGEGAKSVSLAVAGQINPQRIITEGNIDGFFSALVIISSSGLMNILLIYIFISIALLFLGRVLGLIMLSILSPLAFASILIPGLQNNKWVGLQNWFSQLFSLAIMAPVFIFFMYITISFITSDGLLASLQTGGDHWLRTILNVYMMFFMVGGLLWLSKSVTKDMAGNIGGMFGKAVAGLSGAVVGATALVATGGTAAAAGGLGGIGRGLGYATSLGGKKPNSVSNALNRFGSGSLRAARFASSIKVDPTKIPGFEGAAGKTVTNIMKPITGKSIGGQYASWRRKEAEKDDGILFGTLDAEGAKIGKDSVAAAEARAKNQEARGKSAADWQKEVNKAKDKRAQNKITEETKKEMENATVSVPSGTPGGAPTPMNMEDIREYEKEAYRNRIDNPDAVKKEDKDLKKLNEELSNLTSTLNAAKATGNATQITIAQANVDSQKVRVDARKKGRDISKTDAEDLILTNGGNINFIKTSSRGTYTSKGSQTDNFKSEHEHQRKWVQEQETKLIKDKISRLRADGKDNEATLLAKKLNSLLTDSERDDKKGDFDKK